MTNLQVFDYNSKQVRATGDSHTGRLANNFYSAIFH